MRRGDIVWVDLPLIAGSRVQGGRRPTICVLSNASRHGNLMVMVVPLTTTLATTRFPYTLQVEPSGQNGLSAPSVALVFQLCAADRKAIDPTRLGYLESGYMTQIDAMLREMLGL